MTDIFCVEKTCRCCLTTKAPLHDMAATIIFNKKLEVSSCLLEEYLMFSSINADRNERFMACKTCYRKLEATFVFREICKKSNEVFERTETKNAVIIHSPESTAVSFQPTTISITFEEIKVPLFAEPKYIKSEPSSDNDDHYFVGFQPMDCEDAKPDANDSKGDIKEPIMNTAEIIAKAPHLRTLERSLDKTNKLAINCKRKKKRSLVGPIRVASPDYAADLANKDQSTSMYRPAEYLCLVCDKKFPYFEAIRRHRKHRKCQDLKRKKNHRKCELCEKKMTSASPYEKHLSLNHPDYLPQRCTECSASFLSHYALKDHLDVHAYGEDNKCLACSKYFKSEKHLQEHISNEDHNPGALTTAKVLFNCPYCGLAFDRITPLTEHVKEKHPRKVYQKYFPCFWCKRIYFAVEELQQCLDLYCANRKIRNYYKMKKLQATPFECQKCDETFYIEEDLRCHDISMHLKVKEMIFCNDCNENFATQDEVRLHRRDAHPVSRKAPELSFSKNKFHQCEECGVCYNNANSLALHIMNHTMERPFKCDICSFSGKTKMSVSTHKQKRHCQGKEFECNACGKKYKNMANLQGHLIREHFPHMKRHKCDFCERTLVTNQEKLKHHRSHTGDRPFKCTIAGCRNDYKTDLGLINHIQSRHTTIRYECRICDAKLADKTNFWQHAFTHKGCYPFNCPACSYGCYQKYIFKPHLKNKHGIVYSEETHGYHKETMAEVIATCIKITPQNEANFRADKMHYKNDLKFVVQRAMEMQNSETQPEACASTAQPDETYSQPPQPALEGYHFY